MKKLLHIWARLKRLRWQEIRHLAILCLTVFVVAVCTTTLDISATAILLQERGIVGIGFDYLLTAIGLSIAGGFALRLERRKGFGSAMISLILTFLWTGLAFIANYKTWQISIDLMFALKYSTIFLLNIAFWALAKRYIKIAMTSLKFLGVLSFETAGTIVGALFAYTETITLALQMAVLGLIMTTILFKILGILIFVPKETFIRKIGGVQDTAEKVIVDVILAISFCWTFLHALTEFQIYALITESNESPIQILSLIYLVFAAGTALWIVFLTQARFLYTIQFGLFLCALSAGICALGTIINFDLMVYGGAVLFFVTSQFYILQYLSLLPRPLPEGKGARIKKMRWLVMRPCAFALLGALLLTLPNLILPWFLMSGMVILVVLFALSMHLYGRQLVKMCSLRVWCGGPLMLAYPPLKQMVLQGITKPNAAEAIYFLNILKEGDSGNYKKLLTQMLQHPAIPVRLSVLTKMSKLGLTLKQKRQISGIMKTDPCEEVRNMALATLITDALETQGSSAWQKYKAYLDDKNWLWGACMGFLSDKGAWREKVINAVLKLANSEKEKDNLVALSIMQAHPRTEWIEAVEHLLNKTDLSIVKASLTVAGKLGAPQLLSRILPMLDEIRWRDHVLETLDQYGKQAFPSIEKMILSENVPLDRQKELILFLGRLPSGEGKQILFRTLFTANSLLRPAIIESLSDSEIVWIHKDRKNILERSLKSSVVDWHQMNEMLAQTANLEAKQLMEIKTLFQDAFREELMRTRNLILDQISLYTTVPLAIQAITTLKSNDLNAYANAAGCLQDILSKKIYKNVRPILLYPTINEPPKELAQISAEVFLNRFILNPFHWTTPWLKALALYGWRELKNTAGLVAVQEGLKATDWIVLEAALSALGQLEKNKSKATEMVLSVPTRYLLQQNFEKLLEGRDVHHN